MAFGRIRHSKKKVYRALRRDTAEGTRYGAQKKLTIKVGVFRQASGGYCAETKYRRGHRSSWLIGCGRTPTVAVKNTLRKWIRKAK